MFARRTFSFALAISYLNCANFTCNFDSALDARYAIAKGVVWGTYIHPLAVLEEKEFISGVGQVVNLALTFGTSYSSGALIFQGGDSQELQQRRQLIDDLLKKGLEI